MFAAALLSFGSSSFAPAVWAGENGDSAVVEAPKNIEELKAIQAKVTSVVSKVLPSIVAVRVGPSQGSGVVVTKDGYVMTAGHVGGKPDQDVVFLFPDGKTAKGKTLGIHGRADAGLMKITDEGQWPFVEMGRSGEKKLGDWSVAVGHPLGFQDGRPPVVRIGRILRSEDSVIQTDCPLVAGDSGGPLFDLDAKVIGINSRIAGSVRMNFHVPVDVFHDVWDRLVKGEAWEEGIPGRDSVEVRTTFQEVVEQAGKCVVRVKCDGEDSVLGTVVGPDGWVLTKASELKGTIACRTRDGKELEAEVIGVNPQFDLAMLKTDADGLPRIDWHTGKRTAVGHWVASPGVADGPPMALGVVSVPQRRIPPASGVLGVAVGDAEDGARVIRILPESAAQKAGLQAEDVITHVNGKATKNREVLVDTIKSYRPGIVVQLKIKRGDEELTLSAKLTRLRTPSSQKRDMQNRSNVGISRRNDDFPLVLQHDMVLRPADCGGPLVDLSGKVIGINIARGGRTETYAVPSAVLMTLMYDLMSGRLRPPESQGEGKAKTEEKQADAEKKSQPQKRAEETEPAEGEQEKKPEETNSSSQALVPGGYVAG
jgi:serine protease Do